MGSPVLGLDDPETTKPPVIKRKKWFSRKPRLAINALIDHEEAPLPAWLKMFGFGLLLLLAVGVSVSISDFRRAALTEEVRTAVAQINPTIDTKLKQVDSRLEAWKAGQEAKTDERLTTVERGMEGFQDRVNQNVAGLDATVRRFAQRIPEQDQVLQWIAEDRRVWVKGQAQDPDSTLNRIAEHQAVKVLGQERGTLVEELTVKVAEQVAADTRQKVRDEYQRLLAETRRDAEQAREKVRKQGGLFFRNKKN